MNKSIYNKIITIVSLKQFDKLKELYDNLMIEKENMDEFFELFLETNSLSKSKSDEWVTYNKKFAEYTELTSNIKTAEYYVGL
jgi:uncharacterized phage infection (PIP) family protein YhgE